MSNASGAAVKTEKVEPLRKPPQLPVVYKDLRELKQSLAAGLCSKFDIRSYYRGDMLNWSLDEWKKRIGESFALSQEFPEAMITAIETHLKKTREGEPVVLPKPWMDMKPKNFFKATEVKISHVLDKMQSYESLRLSPSWDRDFTTVGEAVASLRRSDAYAVTNAKTIKGFDLDLGLDEIVKPWAAVYNFIWFGLSPGGLHWDEHDNFLMQLKGTKSLLIYHPDLTRLVDGGAFVTKFPPTKTLAPSTLADHQILQYLPYTIVDLGPGEGVVLPAGAYHAPVATSHDSISLNSFLVARPMQGPYPYLLSFKPNLRKLAKMHLGRKLYDFFGYKLIKKGPYEFV